MMDFLSNLPGLPRKRPPGLVTTLLAMADPVARRGMKQVIGRSLSVQVHEVDNKASFHRAVTFQEIDLIIADAQMNGCHSYDIVEQIRFGRLHCHAFPIVIMLCDPAQQFCHERVLDCGADLVLASTNLAQTLPDHLEKLMQTRKSFSVAPNYIGPERRAEERVGEASAPCLAVPNPLAARTQEMPEADYRRQVSLATHSISLLRRGLFAAPKLPFAPTISAEDRVEDLGSQGIGSKVR